MSLQQATRSDDSSPMLDIHKRPSYIDISVLQRPMTQFDERVCRSLESQFIAEEEEAEPIKTYLRIRPYAKKSEDEVDTVEIKDDKTVVANYSAPAGVRGTKMMKKMEFKFSKVLDGTCSQEYVFEQSISPLLDRFENGESCLVFSYGATNSGKTYTMRGSARKYGIIPRTLYHIFNRFQERIYKGGDIQPFRHNSTRALQGDQQKLILDKKKTLISAAKETMEMKQRASIAVPENASDISSHCVSLKYFAGAPTNDNNDTPSVNGHTTAFGMWISFVELYNEKCYDLLAGPGKRKEIKIVSEKGGYAYFKDITELPAFTEEEAYALYVAGYKKLEMSATQANNTSSRSHCFFTIRVVELGMTANSVYPIRVHRITFCDLAGCERICQTENTGGQLKESANINQSLLSLLKVIRMIRDKQAHGYSGQSFLEKIPFRDSKLTRIFQGYFTTSTHIAMIVNVNPVPKMAESSMQTLMNSAIASNVVAFRPKPPPNIVVQDLHLNTSFLHSSLDLEDVLEEEESDSEDSDNANNEPSKIRRKENISIKPSITPSRVLQDKNNCSTLKQNTVRKNFKMLTYENEENIPNETYDSLVIENTNLKLLLSKLSGDLIFKEKQCQSLQESVATVEAETREAMMKQMQVGLQNMRQLEQRNLRLERSDSRNNQFLSRTTQTATSSTQTESNTNFSTVAVQTTPQ